jgi:HIRAN domain
MASHVGLANLRGNGQCGFAVVGEASYQDGLEELAGGRTEESAEHYCGAELIPEPDNPFDRNAVYVTISGEKVGYLPRKTAAR